MRADNRYASRSCLAIACLLALAGCATEPAPERQARAARDAEPAMAESRSAPLAEQPAEPADVIAQILEERRRGDYPEIEVLESGFTITEQAQIRNDARTDYERAQSLLRQERYREGIALLRGIVDTTPDATAPYIDLAIAYGRIDELEEAEQALTNAQRLSPNNPVVYNELGIVYRRTGRFTEARASYEQALAVFEDFHFARRNLAVLCDLYLGDLECAMQNYEAYLATVGTDPEVEIWVADLANRLAN